MLCVGVPRGSRAPVCVHPPQHWCACADVVAERRALNERLIAAETLARMRAEDLAMRRVMHEERLDRLEVSMRELYTVCAGKAARKGAEMLAASVRIDVALRGGCCVHSARGSGDSTRAVTAQVESWSRREREWDDMNAAESHSRVAEEAARADDEHRRLVEAAAFQPFHPYFEDTRACLRSLQRVRPARAVLCDLCCGGVDVCVMQLTQCSRRLR